MKVVKYIVYLIILLAIGGAILISTDKGEFTIINTKTVQAPKSMVYDALKNWDTWGEWHKRWTEDPTTSLSSNEEVLEWASNNKIYKKGIATFSKKIPYKTLEFDTEIEAGTGTLTQFNTINLKELGEFQTEVTWETEIKLSFWPKLEMRLGRGSHYLNSETELFISSLSTLDSLLNDRMNQHNSEVMGITLLPERNYIHVATASNKDNFIATARKKIKRLYDYTERYGIPVKGAPIVIIHKRENNNRNYLFSVALPLPDEYALNLEDPEIVIGAFEARSALKTSLKGNYKYWEETLDLGVNYLEQQGFDVPLEEGIILKWTNYKDLPVNPAEWLTEIYIPAYESETLLN